MCACDHKKRLLLMPRSHPQDFSRRDGAVKRKIGLTSPTSRTTTRRATERATSFPQRRGEERRGEERSASASCWAIRERACGDCCVDKRWLRQLATSVGNKPSRWAPGSEAIHTGFSRPQFSPCHISCWHDGHWASGGWISVAEISLAFRD